MVISSYYDQEQIKLAITTGRHRDLVGGMWSEIGRLQFDFMRAQGLTHDMLFLDIGCGCFRGGVHFVEYHDVGHYYCLEMSQALLDVGFEQELKPAGLADKLPRGNCLCSVDFDFTPLDNIKLDMALALSVFTHVTFNQIRLCLERLAPRIEKRGTFYASFFECPSTESLADSIYHEPGGVSTYGARDPYHYRIEDFIYAAKSLPWSVSYIGDWGHPRDQKMIRFTKT